MSEDISMKNLLECYYPSLGQMSVGRCRSALDEGLGIIKTISILTASYKPGGVGFRGA